MDRLDPTLPHQSYSLTEFVATAKKLQGTDLTEFVLNGVVPNDHLVVVDPMLNAIAEHHPMTASRDFDSLIGIHHDILVQENLYVYPVPRFSDSLSENIHITIPMRINDVEVKIPLHKIPNIMFGKWKERHMIRVCFPSKYDSEGNTELSVEEQAEFYEKGLLPALNEISSLNTLEWPSSIRNELFRARKNTGAYAFQTKVVSHFDTPTLGDVLREHLASSNVEWAAGLFFSYQIRGIKHGNGHGCDAQSAQMALTNFIEDSALPFDQLSEDELNYWWIDVGLEISSNTQACLQWRTDSHFHVMEHFLCIDLQNAHRITSLGSSKYDRDLSAHLTGVSGCRIVPGAHAEGPFEVCYVQMYATDKAITYCPDRQHKGKTLQGKDAIGSTVPPSFCSGLYDVYKDATNTNSSKARIELRVPFRFATHVLLRPPPHLVRNSLLAFTPNTWWGFRAIRLEAATHILSAQQRSNRAERTGHAALVLTAGLVWFINSLHSRPEEGKSCRDLMNAILIHERIYDNDDRQWPVRMPKYEDNFYRYETSARVSRGAIFFRALVLTPDTTVPRMVHGIYVEPDTFKYFFGMELDLLHFKINPIGTAPAGAGPQLVRSRNKSRTTVNYIPRVEEPEPALFSLAHRGFTAPILEEDFEDDWYDPNDGIDNIVSALYRQFIIDVISRSPNPKETYLPSYCIIPEDDRASVQEIVFKNKTLSDVFNCCYYKVAKEPMWKTIFGHLWPDKNTVRLRKCQNYRQSKYYTRWEKLVEGLENRDVEGIRAQIEAKVSTLYWLPHAQRDRMWTTKKENGFTRLGTDFGLNKLSAPRILVRDHAPTWFDDLPAL